MSTGLIEELEAHFNAVKQLLEKVEDDFVVLNADEDLALLEQYLVLKMEQIDMAFEDCAARLAGGEQDSKAADLEDALEKSVNEVSDLFCFRRNQYLH